MARRNSTFSSSTIDSYSKKSNNSNKTSKRPSLGCPSITYPDSSCFSIPSISDISYPNKDCGGRGEQKSCQCDKKDKRKNKNRYDDSFDSLPSFESNHGCNKPQQRGCNKFSECGHDKSSQCGCGGRPQQCSFECRDSCNQPHGGCVGINNNYNLIAGGYNGGYGNNYNSIPGYAGGYPPYLPSPIGYPPPYLPQPLHHMPPPFSVPPVSFIIPVTIIPTSCASRCW